MRLVKKSGIVPSRLLYLRLTKVKSFTFESNDGIWPMKLLFQSKSLVTFIRFPSHMGNAPAKLQSYKIQKISEDRLHICCYLKVMIESYR